MEIDGKKAIVVGGASGMARATAESLAKRGASVAVLDRPQSKGAEVADAIGGTFHAVDVTDFDGTEQVLQQAVDALGGLHIAVNTAGGGIGKRTIKKDGPHTLDVVPPDRRSQPHRHLQHQPAGGLAHEQERARRRRARSAASSSTPRRSPRSRARSARSPTPRPRPASPACA